jgi:hypothetical protein
MSSTGIEALSPMQEAMPVKRLARLAIRPVKLGEGTIGLLDNAKPGADQLLEAIARRLESKFEVRHFARLRKIPNFSKHITDEEAKQLSHCTAVITAIGD